ncbi:mCG148186 [Mus musculus]|jgi:hypothetical protein|nr:mCG148186 [Mus musculus]
MEISVEALQKPIKNRTTIRHSYATPGHVPKRFCILPQRHYTVMFIVSLFKAKAELAEKPSISRMETESMEFIGKYTKV